ncbi:MAG: DNA alkylation repair protein [Saprospiraceae bacterium]
MTLQEVMKELESMGDANTKKTLMRHGAREPFFGVKVADLKKILKKTKKNHQLSLELFETGNSDAMYLAGLMADEKQIGKKELNNWVKKAYWSYLSEYAVPWVAAETDYGFELGMEWIDSKEENIKAAGWATLASFASYQPDEKIDVDAYSKLLERVQATIHEGDNREKYAMNGFIIATASYIPSLTEKAKRVADSIGTVMVDMNGTACKVPLAKTYIKSRRQRKDWK